MGFFKNVGKGLGSIVKGNISQGIKEIGGNVSSGTTRDTQAEATAIVIKQLVDKWLSANNLRSTLLNNAKALSAVTPSLQTSEVKAMIAKVKAELDVGKSAVSNSLNTMLGGLLNQAITGIGNGLNAGLGTTVNNGITKFGEKLLGSKSASSIKDQLGNFFGGVANTALWTTIKKNWYIAITVAGFGIWVIVKLIQMLSGKTRKSGKGYRTK